MEDVKLKVTNEMVVRFLFNRAHDADGNFVGCGTDFGIQDEVDNVTHFHYHIVDLCKNIINSTMTYKRLPNPDYSGIISEAELMVINNAFSNLLEHLIKDTIDYENYRDGISKILNGDNK